MAAKVTQSVCDTPLRVQCDRLWEDVGEGPHVLTVWVMPPNVRLYLTCSRYGVEHIHRQTCRRKTYKNTQIFRIDIKI